MARRSFTSSLPAFRLMRAAIAMGILLLLMLWARAQVNATLETIPPASDLAASDLAGVEASIRTALDVALWIGVAATVLALVFTWYRSQRDHQDLRRIAEGASRFSKNELSFRIRPSGEPEWDRVTISMNRMARTLREQLAELQRQRMEQNAILESMSSSLIALDREHHLLTMNRTAERFFNLGPESRGRLLEEILREPALHKVVEEVLRLDEVRRTEFESTTIPGRRLSATAQRMFDESDQSIGAVLVVDDVTEIRRLESMRSDFAANVSHELRTPITSIQGYAETLEEVGADDPVQFSKFMSIIRRNADRLGAIIEDLLTLASLERPGPIDEADLERTPLRTLCLEVRDRMSRLAAQRGIELVFEDDEGIEVMTRGDLLVEAISNLVSNAIRYGPDGTPVVIRTELVETPQNAGQHLRIEVVDQGPGIAERHVPRLFERFYRVDKARSRSDGGTGLGLAIAKHIALVHGGELSVDTKVGAGSRFTLTIPRARKIDS